MASLNYVYLIMVLRLADNLMRRNVKRPRKLGPTYYYYTKKTVKKECGLRILLLTNLGSQLPVLSIIHQAKDIVIIMQKSVKC